MYVAGVLEFLSPEMLELAGNASRENKKKQCITPRLLMICTICHVHNPCCTHAPTVHTARTQCAHCTHALCTLHAHIVHIAGTHCARCTHARTVHAACTHTLCLLHARTVHSERAGRSSRLDLGPMFMCKCVVPKHDEHNEGCGKQQSAVTESRKDAVERTRTLLQCGKSDCGFQK